MSRPRGAATMQTMTAANELAAKLRGRAWFQSCGFDATGIVVYLRAAVPAGERRLIPHAVGELRVRTDLVTGGSS